MEQFSDSRINKGRETGLQTAIRSIIVKANKDRAQTTEMTGNT